MKAKSKMVVIVDLAGSDRQVIINSPRARDLLNPMPAVSVWDNVPGQESWWKTIGAGLLLAAAFYLTWVAL